MPTVRLPLSWPFNPRTPGTAKDQHRINVMDEVLGDRVYTLKRPGLLIEKNYDSGVGQGMTFFNGGLYAAINDHLLQVGAAASGTDGSAWTSFGNAEWAPRGLMGIVNLNGQVYLIGGFDIVLNLVYSDVWALKEGGSWLQCTAAAPWAVRTDMMCGVIGDTMYVMGGLTTGNVELNDVWSSTNGVDWTQVTTAAAWSARNGASVISADNGMYLLGGDTGVGLKNDVWFTVDGKTWKEVSPAAITSAGAAAWSTRASAQSYYFQNKLWIAGGAHASTGTNDVWYSSDAGKTWTRATAAAWDTGRYGGGAVVYNKKMWLINGYTGAAASNKVYSSPDGVTWTLVTASGPWAASYDGGVYLASVPTGVSSFAYETIWWVGGNDASVTPSKVQYYGALNAVLAADTTLSTQTPNQPVQFAPFNNNDQLLMKNQTNLWVISAGSVIPAGGTVGSAIVGDARYPARTVPGIVVLGGYAYVMDPTGLIRNCELNDPFHWPLLNAVGADYESDPGVAICKYLNYLVAFGTYTTQFFYDAGVTQGSPLRPYLNANMRVGCFAAATVVNVGPTVVWVSRTLEFNRQVMLFNGLSPQVISTPAVDKIINATDYYDLSAFAAYGNGHLFYVLSGTTGNSLAYDLSTKQWYEWSNAASSGPFSYVASCSNGQQGGYFLLHPTNGNIYKFDGSYLNDDGTPFTVTLLTGLVDFGNNRKKFWGQTELIADLNVGSPLIQTTDNDYISYDAGRTVNTATIRPSLYRNGASRRRAWKVTMSNSVAMRWEVLEVTYEQGQ